MKWISTKDRMPPLEEQDRILQCTKSVYVYDKNSNEFNFGFFVWHKSGDILEFYGVDKDLEDTNCFPTHWLDVDSSEVVN